MANGSFIFLPDIHAGMEMVYDIKSAKHLRRPTHDIKFFKSILLAIKKIEPKYIILGGDQLDNHSVARFNKDSKISQVKDLLVEQYDLFNNLFLCPLLDTGANIIWLQGNHDARIVDFIEKNPMVAGLTEPWTYLELQKRGVQLYNRGEVFKLGKLYFTHGDNIPASGDIAKSAANHYHRNIRFGHFHTYRAYTQFSPVDALDTKTAIAVPALTHRSMGWANGKPNPCLQGFCYGDVTKRGNFMDTVVVRTPEGFKVGSEVFI
jgi:metallophosphoesterase superfamily enzyme